MFGKRFEQPLLALLHILDDLGAVLPGYLEVGRITLTAKDDAGHAVAVVESDVVIILLVAAKARIPRINLADVELEHRAV